MNDQDIKARLVRIESRLCRLMEHTGVDIRPVGAALRLVAAGDTGLLTVDTSVPDVTPSEVLHFIDKYGISADNASVRVTYQGNVLMIVYGAALA